MFFILHLCVFAFYDFATLREILYADTCNLTYLKGKIHA